VNRSPTGGHPTLPASFAALDGLLADYDRASVAILPVPYDATTSYRGGARDGPRAIIDASRFLELYEPDLDLEPSDWGIATLPEMEPDVSSPQATIERVAVAVRTLITDGKLPVTLGGEHSITVGAVRAAREAYPDLSVLQLDAHADMRETYMGSQFSHATVMCRVREMVSSVSQVGVRSISREEREHLRQIEGEFPFYAEGDLLDPGRREAAIAPLSSQVYVTIDLDAFDPGFMPAVGTPEPGGISWVEAITLLRQVAERSQIVGFDVVELAPSEGPVASAFSAARLAYKLIGYAVALGPGARSKPA
jgi:agmatinase